MMKNTEEREKINKQIKLSKTILASVFAFSIINFFMWDYEGMPVWADIFLFTFNLALMAFAALVAKGVLVEPYEEEEEDEDDDDKS